MKKIIQAWPLLLFIPGAVLFLFANYYIDYPTAYVLMFLASILVVSVGVFVYTRNKDKRSGRKYLILKPKNTQQTSSSA